MIYTSWCFCLPEGFFFLASAPENPCFGQISPRAQKAAKKKRKWAYPSGSIWRIQCFSI